MSHIEPADRAIAPSRLPQRKILVKLLSQEALMAYRWLGVLLLSAVCAAGCADGGTGGPRGSGASGGSGGVGGVGAMDGTGGTGGVAGSGGSVANQCMTSVLCPSCPSEDPCDDNMDCADGLVCIESGCDDLDGAPIKRCVFAGGGACTSDAMCPSGRECLDVPGEGKRCVRTAPGCDTNFDCVSGFTCEAGGCVDRRVPCVLDEHCPMNHVCVSANDSSFCVRVHTDCLAAFDCVAVAPSCADIDGDGRSECAGTFDPNDPLSEACTNEQCIDAAAPVCQASSVSSWTQCGSYGLCLNGDDCAPGFACAGLWPDGRKECVEAEGASCTSYVDCQVREVCASPRQGGPPSCQAGYQP